MKQYIFSIIFYSCLLFIVSCTKDNDLEGKNKFTCTVTYKGVFSDEPETRIYYYELRVNQHRDNDYVWTTQYKGETYQGAETKEDALNFCYVVEITTQATDILYCGCD